MVKRVWTKNDIEHYRTFRTSRLRSQFLETVECLDKPSSKKFMVPLLLFTYHFSILTSKEYKINNKESKHSNNSVFLCNCVSRPLALVDNHEDFLCVVRGVISIVVVGREPLLFLSVPISDSIRWPLVEWLSTDLV